MNNKINDLCFSNSQIDNILQQILNLTYVSRDKLVIDSCSEPETV